LQSGEGMKLYGTDVCTDCIMAKKLLEKNNQSYDWIDVSNIPDFEGEIPRLEIDDVPLISIDNKQVVVGLGGITKYLRGL